MKRSDQSRVRRTQETVRLHFDALEERTLLSAFAHRPNRAAEFAETDRPTAGAVDAIPARWDCGGATNAIAARNGGGPDGQAVAAGVAARSFDLASIGRNTYFILQPGHTLTLEGEEDDQLVRLVITVLDETEIVDGVQTRVVEERESKDGELVEVSRNFFAIDRNTNDVYYFGEDVDIYENGQIVSHEGAWRSGVDGARFGLFMPGEPRRGMRFAQENAPGVAEDQAQILGFREMVRTPAGVFHRVLAVRETTPLEPSAVSMKLYAPGVGLIKDDVLKLVSVARPFDFASIGRNTYFILEPNHALTLEGEEEGEEVRLTITVLDETEVVDGVETRVVEERESKGGELVEVSRNFFAIDRFTNDVYYFGEDVDIYENGLIVSHDGAWRSGVDGARFGLFMPADPQRGMRFAQENAPGVAEDQAQILGFREEVRTPAGIFHHVLVVHETTPLEPSSVSIKLYAPNVGLIKDDVLKLVKVT